MLNKFRRLLTPPFFEDDEGKTRAASVLNVLLLSLIFGLVLIGIVTRFDRLINYILSLMLTIGAWLIMRRGRVRFASITIVVGLSILLAIVIPVTGGVRATTYGGFLLVILLAGLLLGQWTSMAVALFASLLGAFLLGIQALGLWKALTSSASDLTYWIVFTVYFFVTAVVLTLALQLIDDGFRKAQTELTERKRAEDALRVSENRLQQAIRAANIGIFDHDHLTDTIYWSPEQRNNYGWEMEEKVTLAAFLAQVHAEDRERISLAVQRAHDPTGDGLFDVEHRIIRRDGIIRWLSTRSQTFFEEKALNRTIGAVVDITERKQAETDRESFIKELEMRNAEIERFLYTASHDLKSPVVTIKGFLGMLKKDMEENRQERIQKDFQRISDAAEKMGTLLSDLLELSRIGHIANPPEEIHLGKLVQEILEKLEGPIQSNKVNVRVSPDLPIIYGDRVRLHEVFENLIDNAAKYMGDQSTPLIEIGKREIGSETIIFVKDNGIGIEKQFHTKIFGLFEKLNGESEGTGIGLALIKRIIEVHGGRIWVESDGPRKGSTFCFTIPDGK
jgi:PAS domain S-box-containing protein